MAITNCLLWAAAWTPYAVVVMIGCFGDRSMVSESLPKITLKFTSKCDIVFRFLLWSAKYQLLELKLLLVSTQWCLLYLIQNIDKPFKKNYRAWVSERRKIQMVKLKCRLLNLIHRNYLLKYIYLEVFDYDIIFYCADYAM